MVRVRQTNIALLLECAYKMSPGDRTVNRLGGLTQITPHNHEPTSEISQCDQARPSHRGLDARTFG
jgi:hypothetical protein